MAIAKGSSISRSRSPIATEIGSAIDVLVESPFRCPNCDAVTERSLFCLPTCEDEASFVRYFRACIDDGRSEKRDVKVALRTRLAHILGGGYAERLRWLSKTVREAVISRDQGRCVNCGDLGTQIDHIRGNSGDMNNLQLLCGPCHQAKTESNFVSISRASHPAAFAKRDGLLLRVYAVYPELPCDDHVSWAKISRAVRSGRHRLIRQSKDRCSGKRCPVCLAALRMTPRREYLRTHQSRMNSCGKCLSQVLAGAVCLHCAALSIWANESIAACQSCGAHGSKTQVIAA